MADHLVNLAPDSAAPIRYRDMGDGSFAVVIANGGSGPTAGYPPGVTPVSAASGNVANASAAATLAGAASKTTFISGFEVTGGGATAASIILVTVAGLLGGTATYAVAVPAGVTLGITPLLVTFTPPLPASTTNTAIVVTAAAFGAGNTNAAVAAHGYQA